MSLFGEPYSFPSGHQQPKRELKKATAFQTMVAQLVAQEIPMKHVERLGAVWVWYPSSTDDGWGPLAGMVLPRTGPLHSDLDLKIP